MPPVDDAELLRVACFLWRVGNLYWGADDFLFHDLALDACTMYLRHTRRGVATKEEAVRFLTERAADFPEAKRLQRVYDLLQRLDQCRSDELAPGFGLEASPNLYDVTHYRGSLPDVAPAADTKLERVRIAVFQRGDFRKHTEDLELTCRICLAHEALCSACHGSPVSFVVRRLNAAANSKRLQGWSIQDVESRLRVFRSGSANRKWPNAIALFLEITNPKLYEKVRERYITGSDVRTTFWTKKANKQGEPLRKTQSKPRPIVFDPWTEFYRETLEAVKESTREGSPAQFH